jgi:glucose dehydrogenase
LGYFFINSIDEPSIGWIEKKAEGSPLLSTAKRRRSDVAIPVERSDPRFGNIRNAGGLVFIAATNDKRFRAFDSKTGKELWAANLDFSAHAVRITYQGKNGKQYLAIVAAGTSAVDDPGPAEW